MKRRHPIARFFAHLVSSAIPSKWQVNRHFSAVALRNIEQAIKASEATHSGEIRFVVEAGLHPMEVLYKKHPKKRAIELFGQFNIWDTAHNNGVLIYLLLADRDVEIVGDRGIDQFLGHDGWEEICHDMELLFRKGEFEAGVLQGIAKVTAVLQTHFPPTGAGKNEVANKPLIL